MAANLLKTTLNNGMSTMSGGVADTAGVGQVWAVTYSGSPVASGSYLSLKLLDGESLTTVQIGGNDTINVIPSFCLTFNNKLYMLAGSQVFFSAIGDPKTFIDLNSTGNGFVTLSNQTQTPEDLIAVVPFQGRLAFFSRQTTQLWSVNADPNLWQQEQVLQNIGTFAKYSVQQIGDFDVLFLSDTGIRSLHAKEVTLNAFVDDVGSPIDSIIQNVILNASAFTIFPRACSVVEPSTGRYWLFLAGVGADIDGKIYVLSRFPSSKVQAWSTYDPVDSTGTKFYPIKMFIFQGRVYAWAGAKDLYVYGGTDGNTYDSTVATWETGWLDIKTPGRMKHGIALNAAYSGNWSISVGMDPVSATFEPVAWSGTAHTYDKGRVPFRSRGTHIKAKGVSSGSGLAVFSQIALHYNEANDV